MLDIDFTTVIFQIINFLILVVILYFLLFKKIVRRAELRRLELDEMRKNTIQNLEESEKLKTELQKAILDIDQRIEDAFDKAKNDLEETRNKVMDELKEEADQVLKRNHESVRLSQQQSFEEYHSEIIQSALSISKEMLKKIIPAETHDALIKQISERVLELGRKDVAQIETVRKSLTDREPILFIQTAKALNKDHQASLIRTFSALADRNVKLDIKLEEDLISGIRIRLGDYIIDNSLSSKLDEIGESASDEWQKIISD